MTVNTAFSLSTHLHRADQATSFKIGRQQNLVLGEQQHGSPGSQTQDLVYN